MIQSNERKSPDWRHICTDTAAKKYNQPCVRLKWKLTCWGPDWYAPRYAVLIADGKKKWNFRAVKGVMKSDFYADIFFQCTLKLGTTDLSRYVEYCNNFSIIMDNYLQLTDKYCGELAASSSLVVDLFNHSSSNLGTLSSLWFMNTAHSWLDIALYIPWLREATLETVCWNSSAALWVTERKLLKDFLVLVTQFVCW